MQEAWGEKADVQAPLSKGHENSEERQMGSERKPSKRREIQEERTAVLDLLRDLLSRVNQRYHKPPQPQARQTQKIAKTSKTNARNRRKQIVREGAEARVQQGSSTQRKQQLWSEYSVLMEYTVTEGLWG